MDLNLLLTFEALFETRSVSKASERLGISQPSMSHALAKMREALNDPLFVRVKNEMQPTHRAISIAVAVRKVLAITRGEIFLTQSFDAQRSNKTFTLCMTDIGAASYLPAIVNQVIKAAPNVTIRTISPIVEKQTEGLESGLVDLAVGYFPDIKHAGIFQQRLLRNTGFSCIANKNNPHIKKGRLTLETFLNAKHVSVRTEGRSQEVIENALTGLGLKRQIMLTVPHYLSLLTLVSNTELLAIIPNDLKAAFEAQLHVQVCALPFKSPTVEIKQIWHKRFHKDPASQWIRDVVRQALKES
ncbi:LysR family transcriptional regulator [Pusillimonas sp. T2]|nr:LysR family transcriptional regulator [Pusillimonas sp. T2]